MTQLGGTWNAKLVCRLSHTITRENSGCSIDFDGRSVTLTVFTGDPRPDGVTTFLTTGLINEDEAWYFGYKLRQSIITAYSKKGLGVSFPSNSEDSCVSQTAQEICKLNGKNSIAGLSIYQPLPGMMAGAISRAYGHQSFRPEYIEEMLSQSPNRTSHIPLKIAEAVEMMALAGNANEPLNQAALYIAAVEKLALRNWNKSQLELLRKAERMVRASTRISIESKNTLADAIAGAHKSIRQGYKELIIKKLKLPKVDFKEFDSIYAERSEILHSLNNYEPSKHSALANRAKPICTKIVFTAIEKGINL